MQQNINNQSLIEEEFKVKYHNLFNNLEKKNS
jgi:hypothetical protein